MSQGQSDPDNMEQDYKTLILEVNRLAGIGDHLGAIRVLQKLIDHPQLPATDRAVMNLNRAILLAKTSQSTQALEAYDQAIAVKDSGIEGQLREYKAAYLAEIGRISESLELYQSLLKSPDFKEEDRQRFKHNIETLDHRLKP